MIRLRFLARGALFIALLAGCDDSTEASSEPLYGRGSLPKGSKTAGSASAAPAGSGLASVGASVFGSGAKPAASAAASATAGGGDDPDFGEDDANDETEPKATAEKNDDGDESPDSAEEAADSPPSEEKPAKPRPAAAAAAKRSATAGIDPGGVEQKFDLITNGVAPREELRYAFTKGKKGRAEVMQRTTLTFQMKGREMSAPANAISMVALLSIESVDDDGSAHRRFEFSKVKLLDDPNIPAAQAKQMNGLLAKLNGTHGTDVITSRGFLKGAGMNYASKNAETRAIAQALHQALAETLPPFPDEAVGIGAKWRLRSTIRHMGANLRQTAVYELKERKGDSVVLSVKFRGKSGRSKMDARWLPPGAAAELLELKSKGGGKEQIALGSLVPDAVLKLDAQMRVQVSGGGRKDTSEMKTETRISVQPAKK